MMDWSEPQANPDIFIWNPDRLVDILSRDRLAKYLHRAGNNSTHALHLYDWNQRIGAALTVTLAQVEVCLRNNIGRALTDKFGPAWHRDARLRHNHREVRDELDKAESRIKKPEPSLPDIIAASDFNLWRELCKPSYAGVFWDKRIPIAFPHLTRGKNEREILKDIHARVDLLLKLRNRIAHHEPIIGSNWEQLGAKLAVRRSEAAELLEWMSPDLACWVSARDTFQTVMQLAPSNGAAHRS